MWPYRRLISQMMEMGRRATGDVLVHGPREPIVAVSPGRFTSRRPPAVSQVPP